jgi:hypothetical protein
MHFQKFTRCIYIYIFIYALTQNKKPAKVEGSFFPKENCRFGKLKKYRFCLVMGEIFDLVQNLKPAPLI